jgi:hypothetical protein
MEQQEQRRKFVKNPHKFYELLGLNKAFENGLKRHPNSEYLEEVKSKKLEIHPIFVKFINILIQKFKDESVKKRIHILEFTRGRYTCHEMIEIFKNSGDQKMRDLQLC